MSWEQIHLLVAAIVVALVAAISLASAAHVLLYKRDPRAALGWISLCLTLPVFGALLYAIFGINRLRRRALDWKQGGRRLTATGAFGAAGRIAPPLGGAVPPLEELRRVADRVTHRPIVAGNRLEPLINGEAAYPAMLETIERAKTSVHLATYILDSDRTGTEFAVALNRAAARGVQVRVLIDGMGAKYTWPPARRLFRGSRAEVAIFLPLRHGLSFNLRNHRKILVVDGRTAFTGGMNIGDRHLVGAVSRSGPVADVQFRIEGPIVTDLQRVFLEDWFFATGKMCDDAVLFPSLGPAGIAAARAIDDGPDEVNRKLHWIVMGALASATKSVRIMTPYFIPGRALLSSLGTAALRGIDVSLLLPEKSNLLYMDWATRDYLVELVQFGIRVGLQPAPFVHTKLIVVDDLWSLIGSANLDPRSLRLNFELNVEAYDPAFAGELARHFDEAFAQSRPVTTADLERRPMWQRLRDGATKLASPYL